jgi:hypothetical protein
MVNAAPTFPEVLCQLEEWLDKHELRDGEGLIRAMWVTDGVSSPFRDCLYGYQADIAALGSPVCRTDVF